MKKCILFRCDYGQIFGLGHLMRSLRLANEFKNKGFICIFIISYNKEINNLINQNGHEIFNVTNQFISDKEKIDWINSKKDIVIIDTKKINNKYLNKFKKNFTVCFVDSNITRLNCNIIINNNLLFFKKMKSNKKNILTGLKYNTISKEYFKKNNLSKDNLVVTMGGDDSENITFKIIENIKRLNNFNKIYVIIGMFHPDPDSIYKICNEKLTNYKIFYKLKDLKKIYDKCSFAITACGTTVYELMAYKISFSYISLDSNQKKLASYLNKNKIGYSLGNNKNFYNYDSKFIKFMNIDHVSQKKLFNKILPESGLSNLTKEIIKQGNLHI